MRLKVKFRRGDLYQTLPLGDRVPVVATGTIGADRFVGYDSVKVKRGKVHKPHHGDVLTSGETYWVVYEISSEEAVEWVELLSSFDGGVNWTTELSQLPNTGEIAWPVPPVPAESVLVAVVEVEAEGDSSDEVIGVLGTSEYFAITAPLAVGEAAATLELAPPEPSPSSRDVTLRFSLPRRGQVSLEIYDVQGRKVRTLDSSIREAGRHRLVWRGECDSGESAGPGLYFVRLKADRRAIQRTVVWLR
jgi:hypothetical protein